MRASRAGHDRPSRPCAPEGFAVGTHRARRKKAFVKSALDEIPGIGPARKRALQNAFGSAKDVARAGLADLEKTPGVNATTAKVVYDFFHEAGRG